MYTLIGAKRTRAFRVLWALEEMGLRYDHIPAFPHSSDVSTLNPLGKVPVLKFEDSVLTDSTAILTYLADAHGMLTEKPGTIARAKQDAMTHFLLDELDACLWTAARHSFILPEERRVGDVKDSLRWEWSRSLKELARRLGEGPFLMGEKMTIADIIATHCGTWAKSAKFEITEPSYDAYLDRMTQRPAWIRAQSD